MRPTKKPILTAIAVAFLALAHAASAETVIRRFPVTDAEGVLSRTGVELDREITSDGNGSLRLSATETTTFRLFEVDDPDVEDTRLFYRARVRSDGIVGRAYLEMWCHFPDLGDFFARALHAPLTGTTEWVWQETTFFLEAGQNPDRVSLNLVVEGRGTVWIDDIVLARAGD